MSGLWSKQQQQSAAKCEPDWLDMELESESNPLFGSAQPFKPSLTAITEDEREGSSYVQDGQGDQSSSSTHASTPGKRSNGANKRGECPQESPSKTQGGDAATKRIVRMPSLSRLIRTKSGRVLKQGDMEEKDEEIDEHLTPQKKRSSILGGLFKGNPVSTSSS